MPDTHTLTRLRKAKDRGEPRLDRHSATDAARILRTLLPDDDARRAAEQLLTQLIHHAHARDPSAWTLTLFPAAIRLSLGRVLVAEVLPHHLDIVALAPVPPAHEPFVVETAPFTSIEPDHATLLVPMADLVAATPLLLARAEALAKVTTTQGSPYRHGWSQGVLEALRSSDPTLPLPSWHAEVTSPTAASVPASFIPSEVEALAATLDTLDDGRTARQMRDRFLRRFGPDQLAALEGRQLLDTLHARPSHDTMMYWMEFKNDEVFEARRFGSIAGGSAYKFGLFQRADDQAWVTGGPHTPKVLDEAAAIALATQQRDELVAAYHAIQQLPLDPDHPDWAELPATMRRVAPTVQRLAFAHKALAMWCPERLDEYHNLAYQAHVLASVGVALTTDSLYAAAPWFLRLQQALADGDLPDMNQVVAACNERYGAPTGHWRIGTGEADDNQWARMREGNFVGIGWGELGDLSDLIDGMPSRSAKGALKARHADVWPQATAAVAGSSASQLWQFYDRMQPGDLVYAAHGLTIQGIGEVVGDYRYEASDGPYTHRRNVRWLTTEPMRSPSKKGLMSTVRSLASAYDIQAAGRRHVADEPTTPGPIDPRPVGTIREVHPIEAQLERKGQVLLYGPPGTGKTFHALRVARNLVAHDVHRTAFARLTPEQRAALERDPSGQRIWMCTFHPAYSYEDFVEGLRPTTVAGQLSFAPAKGLFRRVCDAAMQQPDQRFVLIVDEFNRGDAPRIFGELLTLLELDKRDRVEVVLPTSGDRLTVPRNIRLIATMNTADKSIAHLDAALRRRFGFIEYLPDPSVIDHVVEGIPLGTLLEVLNERLLRTLGSFARNLQVGHAYLMGAGNVHTLRSAFHYDVLPLLQEYCADDPDQLHALLGADLYDRARQRLRPAPFERGGEEAFLSALRAWDPDRLATLDDPPDDPDEDEDLAEDA